MITISELNSLKHNATSVKCGADAPKKNDEYQWDGLNGGPKHVWYPNISDILLADRRQTTGEPLDINLVLVSPYDIFFQTRLFVGASLFRYLALCWIFYTIVFFIDSFLFIL